MVIITAWISATGLLFGSWRRFSSHPKGFFSSKLDGWDYQLISREGPFTLGRSLQSYDHCVLQHVTTVILTYKLSTCLKEQALFTASKVWMCCETAWRGEPMLHCRCWEGDTWDHLLCLKMSGVGGLVFFQPQKQNKQKITFSQYSRALIPGLWHPQLVLGAVHCCLYMSCNRSQQPQN